MQLTRIRFATGNNEGAMYVCICNAIRESELRRTARSVAGGAEQVYAALGRTPKCRTCLTTAGSIIVEERAGGLCAA